MKVTVVYEVFWQFKSAAHFKVTKCRKIINCKTSKVVKQTKSGGSIGYNLDGKFYPIKTIKNFLELIPKKTECPF